MEQLYGESPEIRIEDSYARNGGISVMAANDEDNKFTGGSIWDEEGHYFEGYRILWQIQQISENEYSGGVTNIGWYFNDSDSPFYGLDANGNGEQIIFEEAKNTGNLNSFFSKWLADETKNRYQFIVQATEACVDM